MPVCVVHGAMQESLTLPPSSLSLVRPFSRYIAPALNTGVLSPFGIAQFVAGRSISNQQSRLEKFGFRPTVLKETGKEEDPFWNSYKRHVKREHPDSGGSITHRGEVKRERKPDISPFIFPSRRYKRQWRGW